MKPKRKLGFTECECGEIFRNASGRRRRCDECKAARIRLMSKKFSKKRREDLKGFRSNKETEDVPVDGHVKAVQDWNKMMKDAR